MYIQREDHRKVFGGGGRIRSYFTTDREEPAIFLGTEEILDSGVRMSDGETPEEYACTVTPWVKRTVEPEWRCWKCVGPHGESPSYSDPLFYR